MREVEEETGLARRARRRAAVDALHRLARPPEAAFAGGAWSAVTGEFTPTDEVDEIRWLTREEAAELLSYDRDRVLLDAVEVLGGRSAAGRESERRTFANPAA